MHIPHVLIDVLWLGGWVLLVVLPALAVRIFLRGRDSGLPVIMNAYTLVLAALVLAESRQWGHVPGWIPLGGALYMLANACTVVIGGIALIGGISSRMITWGTLGLAALLAGGGNVWMAIRHEVPPSAAVPPSGTPHSLDSTLAAFTGPLMLSAAGIALLSLTLQIWDAWRAKQATVIPVPVLTADEAAKAARFSEITTSPFKILEDDDAPPKPPESFTV